MKTAEEFHKERQIYDVEAIRRIQADAIREAARIAFEHSRRGDYDDGKGNSRITKGKGYLVMELEKIAQDLEKSQ